MVRFVLSVFAMIIVMTGVVAAQSSNDVVWVQIEAQPDFDAAIDRIEVYSQDLPDVAGFSLGGGWYGIALGPYTRNDAQAVLRSYRLQGLIPRDSYIALTSSFRQQYWPAGEDILGRGVAPVAVTQAPQAPQPEASASAPDDTPETPEVKVSTETPAQARRSESRLSREQRQELQTALKWAGYYSAAIDGAFGRGTRNSMGAWQAANGFETTGILTTAQRAALLGQYNAVFDGLGMGLVRDTKSGIEMRIPAGVVSFDRYEPPFAKYTPSTSLPVQLMLISQSGDSATLASLYEIMQTLTIVPLEGPRSLSADRFSIVGRNDKVVTETRVSLNDGSIKGFTLIWPVGDEARRTRVVDEMRNSFQRLSGVLDPAEGAVNGQQVDLFSGLDIRQPILSRSGFYVGSTGAVVTTADAVSSCTRITLDTTYDATLASIDNDRGIAVVTPNESLAPPAIAQLSAQPPRLQSEIAVAGYSFEGQLNAASMTFGTLSDIKGLRGEAELNRLALETLPGDAGGPVMDQSGNVVGMLLTDQKSGRQLPPEVRFSLSSDVIAGLLAQAGLQAQTGQNQSALDPVDITDRAVGMTVLVSCWE